MAYELRAVWTVRLTELQVLQRDLIDERPDWVFSAYGDPWATTSVGNDTSFEEARLHETEQLRNGVSKSQVWTEFQPDQSVWPDAKATLVKC